MVLLQKYKKELKTQANPIQAAILQGFFKTGKGEYGEGDIFLGIKVPIQRKILKSYLSLSFKDLKYLLNSKIHEYRLGAVLILVERYKKGEEKERKSIYKFYLENAERINNWDLVDLSAPHIVGNYLLTSDRKVLYKLAQSKNLWKRRIAILATFTFIRNFEYVDTLLLAEKLLLDKHDLIHKAVGWMLREMGKRDLKVLEGFLNKYHKTMPRVMLRYAVERLEEKKRKFYMQK
ncbi:DNA alkylation repair protein [bacterium]|nr:DNA alkylation repair protein [bacterium]